jgi:hypothetical protein
MPTIRVHHDVDRLIRNLDEAAEKQVPFALARSLTVTARDAQVDVKADLPTKFTLRNTWTARGIRITPARKGTPEAVVGSLEPYMARQETGGNRRPRSHSKIAVPATKQSRVIPKSKRPAALKGKPRVFKIVTRFGAGIVQREGKKRYPLKFLYWLKRGVRVKPRFGFKAEVSDTVEKRFGPNFVQALSQAMGHWG